jgi:hypothetical protein
VEDTDVPDGNVLADKLKINLNMLGMLVLNRVGGEIDSVDVVAVDKVTTSSSVMQWQRLSQHTCPVPHQHWNLLFGFQLLSLDLVLVQVPQRRPYNL